MASTYQLVPYLMQVHVRGKPSETRVISDIDGNQLALADVLARVLDAMRGVEFTDPDDANRKLQLTRLSRGSRTIFAEFSPGRSGIASSIVQDGSTFTRTVKGTEYVPVRHVFFFPQGSHAAVMLAERVGVSGAVTMASQALTRTFATYMSQLLLTIGPAVTAEVMRKLTAGRDVKSLVFTRPNPRDANGKVMHIAGEQVAMEVRFKAPRRRRWGYDALPKENGEVTRDSLLGLLAPHVAAAGVGADVSHLREEGWTAAMEVRLPNNTTRTIDVAASTATTMSFPIGDEDSGAVDDRPTDDEFKAACVATLSVFGDQYGIDSGVASQCQWSAEEWYSPDERWKVPWDEHGVSSADPEGHVPDGVQ